MQNETRNFILRFYQNYSENQRKITVPDGTGRKKQMRSALTKEKIVEGVSMISIVREVTSRSVVDEGSVSNVDSEASLMLIVRVRRHK